MANRGITDRPFVAAYDEAYALYIESRLEECETKARELLRDPDTPRFQRLKTLVLLASLFGNSREARSCWIRAETHWWMARREHSVGEDESMDEQLRELREQLDRFHDKLKNVEQDDEETLLGSQWEDATDDMVRNYHEDVGETWEWIEAPPNDEAEMIDVRLAERKATDFQYGHLETASLDFEIRFQTPRLHAITRPPGFPASRPPITSLIAGWEQRSREMH